MREVTPILRSLVPPKGAGGPDNKPFCRNNIKKTLHLLHCLKTAGSFFYQSGFGFVHPGHMLSFYFRRDVVNESSGGLHAKSSGSGYAMRRILDELFRVPRVPALDNDLDASWKQFHKRPEFIFCLPAVLLPEKTGIQHGVDLMHAQFFYQKRLTML